MTLRDHLQSIYDERGKLTPVDVLEAARSPGHPLHTYFEWDDAEAAESYRLDQARQLIRRVKITYTKSDGSEGEVRAFHAVRLEQGYVYEPNDKVVLDPMLRTLLLRDMEREWKQMRRRYEDFDEFWQMVVRDTREPVAS